MSEQKTGAPYDALPHTEEIPDTAQPNGKAQPNGTAQPNDAPQQTPPGFAPPYQQQFYGQQPGPGGFTPPYPPPLYGPPPFDRPPYKFRPGGSVPATKNQKTVLTNEDLIFTGVAFLLSIFTVMCGLWGGLRVGFTAAFVLLFSAFTVYLGKGNKFPGVFPTVCGLLSLALSAVFVLTDAPSVRGFSFLLLPFLSTIWFAGLSGRKVPDRDLGILSYLFWIFIGSLGKVPAGVRALFSTGNQRVKHTAKILLGVLCALPVLLAVVPLLAHSDEAFSNLLGKMFSDLGQRVLQIVFGVLLTPLLTGFAFYLKKEPQRANSSSAFKGVDTVVLTSALCVLSLCYLIYLFSQLAYFFSGFMGILPEGYDFSHAEYARRGFFELCAIAGINLAVLLTVLLLSKKKDGKPPVLLRVPATFIILFNLLLIVTAVSKLALYIKTYGMTVLRIGTSAFAIFMAFLFLALLLRFYLTRVRVFSLAFPAAACVLAILGIGNVNHFVADYNYQLFISGKSQEIDIDYFGSLGAEGIPYLTMLSKDDDPGVAQKANRVLYDVLPDYYEVEYNDLEDAFDLWGSYKVGEKRYTRPSQFSVPRRRMYQAAEAFLKDHPDFPAKTAAEPTTAAANEAASAAEQ